MRDFAIHALAMLANNVFGLLPIVPSAWCALTGRAGTGGSHRARLQHGDRASREIHRRISRDAYRRRPTWSSSPQHEFMRAI